MVTGGIKTVLRMEGFALFAASLFAYYWLSGSWTMFAVLFFVPDLAFAAYLISPRIGSICYNLLHSTIGPFVLFAFGWWLEPSGGMHILRDIMQFTAIIWMAHVGFDRAVGYGLKYETGFKDTHLGRIGRA